jgi:hypothetical protein
MMGLYFLVLVAVGILRPIKNVLALDGLAEGDFYQVYLVSALVVLFAPLFNHLGDRIPWRRLIRSSTSRLRRAGEQPRCRASCSST